MPSITPMAHFAEQTREMDVLLELFRRLKAAEKSGDYAPVAVMVHPDAVLVTRAGEKKGREAVVDHLKAMGKERYRAQVVAPKGGLVTVNIVPTTWDGTPLGTGHEQVYRLLHDRLVELIDLGRTPDMVYRRESQPN